MVGSQDAPSFVVLGDDTEEGFARLRRGAIAYGMPETYRSLPRDMVNDNDARVLHVRDDGFSPAFVDRSGSLFGAAAEKLMVPRDRSGRPFARVRIPIPSLERPAFVEFSIAPGNAADGLRYTLTGEARERDGYICRYCGKLCEHPEPHTAAHGVAGHARAGVAAGEQDDPVHQQSPETFDQAQEGPRL